MLDLFDYFRYCGPDKYAIFIWSKVQKITKNKFGKGTCKTKSLKSYMYSTKIKKYYFLMLLPKKYGIFIWSKAPKIIKNVNTCFECFRSQNTFMNIFGGLDQKNILYFFGPK